MSDPPKHDLEPPPRFLPSSLELYRQEVPLIILSKELEQRLRLLIELGKWAEEQFEDAPPDDLLTRYMLGQMVNAGLCASHLLVHSHLRQVINIAWSFGDASLPLLDRIQEGNLRLMRAAREFPTIFTFRFSTYARPRIRKAIEGAIDRELRQAGYTQRQSSNRK
ncbi:hypothetical protein LCGC14_2071720 [marine sediment metagenome]|uniref:RNA polymerase sigma-70 region 2 domain-containing protein n=1 Tax=marine sediment metagenome TaxID=412755 RepID=A0A0F9HFA2_9ZZZZ